MTTTPDSNPKAAAKAAKAYAKASRPWFKKKRYILLIAIAVIAIIAAASGGGSSDDGPKAVDSQGSTDNGSKGGAPKKDDKAKVGEEGNPAKVGQTIELEGTRYTVKGAHTANQVGSQYMPEKADGIFIVVDITIENTKDETKTFLSEAAKFVAADGTKYDVDDDAAIMASDDGETLILKEMHPDLPTSGQLIFDVPPAKAKSGVLRVEDLFGSGEAYFRLGLK